MSYYDFPDSRLPPMRLERIFELDDEAAMDTFGGRLAGQITDRTMLTLSGDLGAGKTTLARGILHGLGHRGSVKSPTYTVVEPYDLPLGRVYHFDLYLNSDNYEASTRYQNIRKN